jgi:hypothetical protein
MSINLLDPTQETEADRRLRLAVGISDGDRFEVGIAEGLSEAMEFPPPEPRESFAERRARLLMDRVDIYELAAHAASWEVPGD